MEGGVERVLGNRGLLENRCSKSFAADRQDFLFASQTTPIVETLIVGSPERQIVGVLIVRFPEH